MIWTNIHNAGLLPLIFRADDPRNPIEQANDRYAHGGGWHEGWTRKAVDRGDFQFEHWHQVNRSVLTYETDDMRSEGYPKEKYHELSRTALREWTIVVYEGAWVALRKGDEKHVHLARMD